MELLSYKSVCAGSIDNIFDIAEKDTTSFDSFFLAQIEKWREILAIDILKNNKDINEESINFLIQRLLNRILFLRICEDREIEKYETLRKISNYEELKTLFILSDKKYNSGLFDFIEDNLSLNINLDKQLLINIFEELYYPSSPYDFSVIDPLILSQIYEQYLGSRIALVPQLPIQIVQEPEVVASNGVVPTPKLIAKEIVKETLEALDLKNDLEKIKRIKIADICCGSGTFLIALYDQLINMHIEILLENKIFDDNILYKQSNNIWHLTLNEKRKILSNNIFGVDVNPYAVEVAKFSLLLKFIENENSSSIDYFLNLNNTKILPKLSDNIKCGNSLINDSFYDYDKSCLENDELLFRIKPFNWDDEFPFLKSMDGFDAVIGNPPYVRIQNLVKYSKEEINYYRSKYSPYSVGKKDTFDKYYLFIERAISLINKNGIVGYIVPHKFFIVKGGVKLRSIITEKCNLYKIVHFGVTQIFPGRLTYPAIIILTKKRQDKFLFKRVKEIKSDTYLRDAIGIEYEQERYLKAPWIFLSKEADSLFKKIYSRKTTPLKDIADITVGIQTSADDVFVIHSVKEGGKNVTIKQNGMPWDIEKDILQPCIYDVKLDLYDKPIANSFMIFPYEIKGNKAIVFSENKMENIYPLCWKYLCHNKERLLKRSINGSKDPKWYQFGRSQSLTKFHNSEKLIWKVLSKEASYTYDISNVLFTGGGNGPYYSLINCKEYSILYILAVLSHPIIEAMVKSGASEFQGDYYSHGKQFIENLPIKTIDFENIKEINNYTHIIKLSKELLKTKESIKEVHLESKRLTLHRKYDKLRKLQIESINILYDIKHSEISAIEDDNLFFAEIEKEGKL